MADRFLIRGSKIYDLNDREFIIKGENVYGSGFGSPHNLFNEKSLYKDLWKFNFLRVNFDIQDSFWNLSSRSFTSGQLNGDVARWVNHLTANGDLIVCFAPRGSGSGQIPTPGSSPVSEEKAVAFFQTYATQFRDNPYVWWNTYNEPGGDGTGSWSTLRTFHQRIIAAIRGVGNLNPIFVCGGRWGQDVISAAGSTWSSISDNQSFILGNANQVMGSNSNIGFQVHTYDAWNGGTASTLRGKLNFYFNRARELNLYVMLGEYHSGLDANSYNDYHVSEQLDFARNNKIGVVHWSWANGSNDRFPSVIGGQPLGVRLAAGQPNSNPNYFNGLTNLQLTSYYGAKVWDFNRFNFTLESLAGGSVSISSPTGNQNFSVGQSVPLTATTTNSGGVTTTRVEFYRNDPNTASNLLATRNTPPYSFTSNTLTSNTGRVTIFAKAYFSDNSTNTASVDINIAPSIPRSPTNVPLFDGTDSPVWTQVTNSFNVSNITTGTISSTSDASMTLKLYYSDSYIYGRCSITDEAFVDNAAANLGDSVEVYIKGNTSTVENNRFIFKMNGDAPIENYRQVTTGVRSSIRTVSATNRVLEFGIPASLLGFSSFSSGNTLFVEVEYNDSDASGARAGKLAWFNTTDIAYLGSSNYRPIILGADLAGSGGNTGGGGGNTGGGTVTNPTIPPVTFPPSPGNFTGYEFDYLPTAGGGWVTNLVGSVQDPDVYYAGTDIGGIYKWDQASDRWKTMFSVEPDPAFNGMSGAEAIAVDPSNSNVVYIACGETAYYGAAGAVFRSADGGSSWTRLGLNVSFGSGDNGRWGGPMMAVDPFDPGHIIVGTRVQGLWTTDNFGYYSNDWVRNTSLPAYDNPWNGTDPNPASNRFPTIRAIVFDRNIRDRVYCALYEDGYYYNSAGAKGGIYLSTDGGVTWTKMANQPGGLNKVSQMQVHYDGNATTPGTLWITHELGVAKLVNGTTWANYANTIFPGLDATTRMQGLACCPYNNLEVIVCDRKVSNNTRLFRTTNGGTSWTSLTYDITTTIPWQTAQNDPYHKDSITAITYDPRSRTETARRNVVWFSSFYGMFRAADITASPVVFQTKVNGVSNCSTCLVSCPTPVVSGTTSYEAWLCVLDIGAWGYNNGLNADPSKNINTDYNNAGQFANATNDIRGMDYCRALPLNMVAIGQTRGGGLGGVKGHRSSDGGRTWSVFPSLPPSVNAADADETGSTGSEGLMIRAAYSASTAGVFMVTRTLGSPALTANNATSWITQTTNAPGADTTGLYTNQHNLCADRVNGNKFYYRPSASNSLFLGTWNGSTSSPTLTWTTVNSALVIPNNTIQNNILFRIFAAPGVEGELYYYNSGPYQSDANCVLYKSTNGGTSFSRITYFDRVLVAGCGRAATGSATPYTLYVLGKRNGEIAVHRSIDGGVNWVKCSSKYALKFGNDPSSLEGSMQTFGTYILASDGNSAYVGTLNTDLVGLSVNLLSPTPSTPLYEI